MGSVATQLRRWGPSIGGLILMIVGLGGAPDDVRVWGNWIGDFVGDDGFRLLLVAFGIAIVAVANVPGLRRLSMATWHIMAGADSQPAGLDKFPQLSLIVKHDLADPASMVKIMDRRVVKWDLPARRSEVVFGVTIFNGSVYDVWVSPATGNLMYKGQQLETAILPNQGGAMRLPRGKEYEITLTQYVPDDLTNEVHGEIDSGCIRMFDWMGVSVSLRADRPDAPEARPMFIGDGKGFRRDE